jgi:transposase-like protein
MEWRADEMSRKHGGYSVEFKQQALERMRRGENVSALARELKVRRKLLYDWKRTVEQGRPLRGPGRLKAQPSTAESPAPAAEKRIQELEALVGRLTLENRFFKGALQRIEDLPQASGGNGAKLSLPRSKP